MSQVVTRQARAPAADGAGRVPSAASPCAPTPRATATRCWPPPASVRRARRRRLARGDRPARRRRHRHAVPPLPDPRRPDRGRLPARGREAVRRRRRAAGRPTPAAMRSRSGCAASSATWPPSAAWPMRAEVGARRGRRAVHRAATSGSTTPGDRWSTPPSSAGHDPRRRRPRGRAARDERHLHGQRSARLAGRHAGLDLLIDGLRYRRADGLRYGAAADSTCCARTEAARDPGAQVGRRRRGSP